MSTQINQEQTDFDPTIIQAVKELRKIKTDIAALQEVADLLTETIKSALGDATFGTVNGEPVVRWTTVESSRLDVKKAKEILPAQVLDVLTVKSQSRRFQLLDGSEQW